jgi:superfamily I DNA/RNA helicase
MTVAPYLAAAEDLRSNEEQWAAFESTGNCVILAGPGSGKTKTITVKIARILAEDIDRPQRLACITYSNECVGELRRRVAKLEVDDSKRLLVSTVHSFALTELVLPFAKLANLPIPEPFAVASSADANKFLSLAYKETVGHGPPRSFTTSLERLRRQVPDKSSEEWKKADAQDTAIIECYERLLLENGLMDFDGLVLAGLQLVEQHDWVRRCVRAKYPVIVIDEYQDLGVALDRMVLALMVKAGVRIIAVGDPDQSVYGFTGAKPALLRRLAERKDVERIRLRLNYRCASEIIEASKALLPHGLDSESFDGRTGSIMIQSTGTDVSGQARLAIETLIPAMLAANPRWSPGDIAFLYRSYNEGSAIARVADSLGQRYFRADNGTPVKRSRLNVWLTEAAQWCSGGWKSGEVSLTQLLRSWRVLRRSLNEGPDSVQARGALIKALFSNRDGQAPLRKWLHALYKATVEDMLAQESAMEEEKEAFFNLVKLTEPKKLLANFTVEVFGNQGRSRNHMNLMTLHGSKGLEFHAVLMLGLEAGEFPSRYAVTEEDQQEAARLFYVGVTRATSMVYLLYSTNESPLVTAIRTATSSDIPRR